MGQGFPHWMSGSRVKDYSCLVTLHAMMSWMETTRSRKEETPRNVFSNLLPEHTFGILKISKDKAIIITSSWTHQYAVN